MHVLVFSGTTEGCALARQLSAHDNALITVCSATEYGSSLVPTSARVRSIAGRLDEDAMCTLMRDERADVVVDATHPYAAVATANIARAAERAGVRRIRLVREDEPESEGAWTRAADAEDAARILREKAGNVLLTTGSKELGTFTRTLPDYRERLYVRVLPVEASVAHVRELGIPLEHVIAMKGPFSQSLNEALIREFAISVLVTKASGATGGFWEKIEAAKACGIEVVVICRPAAETGLSLEETLRELERELGVREV